MAEAEAEAEAEADAEASNANSNNNNNKDTTMILNLKDLPNNILIHILSFIPTIDAIKTACLLSPKPSDLWSSIPNLFFSLTFSDHDYALSDLRNRFARFVDLTLLNRSRHSPLRKFHIQFDCAEPDFASRVAAWVRYAVDDAKVIELVLDFSRDYRFLEIFESNFNYAFHFSHLKKNGGSCTVRVLELTSCILTTSPVALSYAPIASLKTLTLRDVTLTDLMVCDVLSSCVNLEVLVIKQCHGMKDLRIHSSSLKQLTLDDFYDGDGSVDIFAPNLVWLRFIRFEVGQYFLDKSSSSLVRADVWFIHTRENYKFWSRIVPLLGHVKHLTLQNWCFKLLVANDRFRGSFRLDSLNYLELQTGFLISELLGIAALLEVSPNLETMIFDILLKLDEEMPNEAVSKKFLTAISFSLPSLRQFKMKSFSGTEEELLFVRLLLKTQVVLEKIELLYIVKDPSFPPFVMVKTPQGFQVV